ncbi:2-deoxyribonucleoside glycosidase [Geomonas sp. Red276]
MQKRRTIYLASPLGFSPELSAYLEKVKAKLASLSFDIFDPWAQAQFAGKIDAALAIADYGKRIAALQQVADEIGRCNAEGIRGADIVFAVLDGAEVDSGTASEVGFGCGLGKTCYGLRTDRRDSGDFAGIPINLQVLHFIECTGGRLFRSIDEIEFPGMP